MGLLACICGGWEIFSLAGLLFWLIRQKVRHIFGVVAVAIMVM